MNNQTTLDHLRAAAGRPIPYTGPGMILSGGPANLASFSRPGVAFAKPGSSQAITASPSPVAAAAPAKPAPPPAVVTPPAPSVPHPLDIYQERAALAAAARASHVSDPLVFARTASPKPPATFAEIAHNAYAERKSRVL